MCLPLSLPPCLSLALRLKACSAPCPIAHTICHAPFRCTPSANHCRCGAQVQTSLFTVWRVATTTTRIMCHMESGRERERYRAGQKPFNSCNTNSNCEWNNCCASSWILCNSFNALAALPFERRRRLLHENELHFALCNGIKRCLGVSLGVASALLGGLSLPKQLAAILKVASRQIKEVDRHKAKQRSQNTKSFTHGKALAKLCHNAATTASKLPQLVVSLPSTLTR